MHRALVRAIDWDSDVIDLPADEAHHLMRVKRIATGDRMLVFDGVGSEATGVVCEAVRGRVRIALDAATRHYEALACRTWLFQAIAKGKRMDMLVEKATELGATDIVPLVTDRTVVRLSSLQAAEKVERWLRIAEGATKQCGTLWVPTIHAVATVGEALTCIGGLALCLVAALQGDPPSMREVLEDRASLRDVGLCIGPEGDFTSDELSALLGGGAVGVSLGPRVLRTETAAMFGLSVLAAAFDPARGSGIRATVA